MLALVRESLQGGEDEETQPQSTVQFQVIVSGIAGLGGSRNRPPALISGFRRLARIR